MKNILGLIYTKNGKTETSDIVGKRFVIRTLDPKLSDEINAQQEELDRLQKSAELPAWFRIGQLVAMALCIILLFVYSKNAEAEWSTVILVAAAVVVAVFAVASLVAKRKEKVKRMKLEQEAQKIIPKMTATYKKAKKNMQIPDNSKEIDVLTQKYVAGENGELKSKSLIMADYASLTEFVWVSGDTFFISGIDMALAIPESSVKEIRKVDRSASFMGWNKRNPYNSAEYRAYGIKRNKYDVYSVKPYYEMVINHEGDEGVIRIPPYELEVIKKLLRMEVAENQQKDNNNTEKIEK